MQLNNHVLSLLLGDYKLGMYVRLSCKFNRINTLVSLEHAYLYL